MRLDQQTELTALDASPADKVGLVLVDALGSSDPLILLTRVKPKNPGERPDLALPRGTREVQDPDTGLWHDPRHLKGTDTTHWKKEPLRPALVREAHEEVGVTEAALNGTTLHDGGIHPFTSRKGDGFTVHWVGAELNLSMLDTMKHRASDATHLQTMRLSEIDRLAAAGEMNPCYAQVAHAVVDGMRAKQLPHYEQAFTEAQRTR